MKKILFLLFIGVVFYGCKEEKDLTSPQTLKDFNKKDYRVSVDNMPMPEGGMEAIQAKIVYPAEAKEKNIQGRVHVLAYINENGDVTSTEVLKGVDPLLDNAAVDAVKDVKFSPGIHEGMAVKTQVAIPIVFKLDGDGKKDAAGLKKDGEFYTEADEMPQIIGGPVALMQKVVYPESEKKKGIQGKVVVAVYVNEKGEIEKSEIAEGFNDNFDKAALNALKGTMFTPGKVKGKSVKVKLYIPFQFKLR